MSFYSRSHLFSKLSRRHPPAIPWRSRLSKQTLLPISLLQNFFCNFIHCLSFCSFSEEDTLDFRIKLRLLTLAYRTLLPFSLSIQSSTSNSPTIPLALSALGPQVSFQFHWSNFSLPQVFAYAGPFVLNTVLYLPPNFHPPQILMLTS